MGGDLSDDGSTSTTNKLGERKRNRAKRSHKRCGFCLTRWVLSAAVRGNRSRVAEATAGPSPLHAHQADAQGSEGTTRDI
jgi:hypothetical protein